MLLRRACRRTIDQPSSDLSQDPAFVLIATERGTADRFLQQLCIWMCFNDVQSKGRAHPKLDRGGAD